LDTPRPATTEDPADEHRTAAAEADQVGAVSFSAPAFRVEQVPIERLRPDPANPRRIDEAELEALTRSIRTYGFVQPIVAQTDGTIIGGHQRLTAARRAGLTEVPVLFRDLPDAQAHVLGLALNRIGGAFDEQLLARLLDELRHEPSIDLSLSGFGEDEIHDLLRRLATAELRDRPEAFDLDAALGEATRSPQTTRGDLIVLGTQRLVCGDATSGVDVGRALDGRRADEAIVDPPYNVGYSGGHGPRAKRRRAIANDDLDASAFESFVRAWAAVLLAAVDGALYIFMSSKELPTVARVLAEAGGHWSDTIVWSKGTFTLGRADYQRSYEPMWYGWREGSPHHWCGDRDQGDVWDIPRPPTSPLHPAQKPTALLVRAIENGSPTGALILDVFAGSGSTLIAAERTGRSWAGVELDPAYCDVIAARWAAFTGGEVRRMHAGEEPAATGGVAS
jgi:DNA modification methylase